MILRGGVIKKREIGVGVFSARDGGEIMDIFGVGVELGNEVR